MFIGINESKILKLGIRRHFPRMGEGSRAHSGLGYCALSTICGSCEVSCAVPMCMFVKSIAEPSLESQTTVTHRGLEAPGSGQRQVRLLSATDPRHLGTSVRVTVDPSFLPFPPWKWCCNFMESYFVRDAAQGAAHGLRSWMAQV